MLLTPLLLCAAPGAAHSLGKGVSGAAAAARVATIPWNSLTGVCLNGAVGPGAQQDRGSIYFLISRVSTAGQGNPRERGCAQGGGGRGGRWGTNTGSAALGWAMGCGGGKSLLMAEPPCLGGLLDDCSGKPMGGEGPAWDCAVGPQLSGGREAGTEISSVPGISDVQSWCSSSPGR